MNSEREMAFFRDGQNLSFRFDKQPTYAIKADFFVYDFRQHLFVFRGSAFNQATMCQISIACERCVHVRMDLWAYQKQIWIAIDGYEAKVPQAIITKAKRSCEFLIQEICTRQGITTGEWDECNRLGSQLFKEYNRILDRNEIKTRYLRQIKKAKEYVAIYPLAGRCCKVRLVDYCPICNDESL